MAETKRIDQFADEADRDRALALDMMTAMQRDMAAMKADTARLTRENFCLMAEKAERDSPQWLTLKRAADKAGCTYERARAFAARAIAAGRVNEARKDRCLSVNTTALIAHLRR
jgi:hypothetical protein